MAYGMPGYSRKGTVEVGFASQEKYIRRWGGWRRLTPRSFRSKQVLTRKVGASRELIDGGVTC
jgi:hypothetical protein